MAAHQLGPTSRWRSDVCIVNPFTRCQDYVIHWEDVQCA